MCLGTVYTYASAVNCVTLVVDGIRLFNSFLNSLAEIDYLFFKSSSKLSSNMFSCKESSNDFFPDITTFTFFLAPGLVSELKSPAMPFFYFSIFRLKKICQQVANTVYIYTIICGNIK